jgi:2-oxoglutarate dehydrogenase E2 component (dihydrolipoamide succinyltransferase)
MRTSILLPEIGVSPGSRITVSAWYALPGDLVFEGDRIVEVLTEGATFDVNAPATGCLVERLALSRDVLQVGQVLGIVESDAPAQQEL